MLLPDLLQGPSRPHLGLVAFCIPWHMIQGNVLKGGICCSRTSRCLLVLHMLPWGFPGSSADKESTYNAGDTSSIPGSGRSPGEGIGYPLQYSRASLVAQTAKNLPAMWKSGFNPWVGKIPWRKAWQPSPVFPGESPWAEEPGFQGISKCQTQLSN